MSDVHSWKIQQLESHQISLSLPVQSQLPPWIRKSTYVNAPVHLSLFTNPLRFELLFSCNAAKLIAGILNTRIEWKCPTALHGAINTNPYIHSLSSGTRGRERYYSFVCVVTLASVRVHEHGWIGVSAGLCVFRFEHSNNRTDFQNSLLYYSAK